MKKITTLLLAIVSILILVACATVPPVDDEDDEEEQPTYYTVTFNSDGGSAVSNQTILENGLIVEPADPTKEGYVFVYWYKEGTTVAYDFSTPVTANLTLIALWEEEEDEPIPTQTNEEMIQEDIEAIAENLMLSKYQVNAVTKGPVNNSNVRWSSINKYISKAGVVLPLLPDDHDDTGVIEARFTLNGTVVTHQYEIELFHEDAVVITTEREVPFTNLTTEYDVEDATATLLFEEDGSVPYIKVKDFFDLLIGFIDPEVDITFETEGNVLTVSYQYVDEEEHEDWVENGSNPEEFDGVYDLVLIVDAAENTLTTPDPGFYWAYVYSTATNYSRHIEYDRYHPDADYQGGDDLVYDLDLYNMDVTVYEGDIVIPYYIANQLFAGSSYYNVYYNYDGLYGIYALPSEGSTEYETIKQSTKNNTEIPSDLVVFNFNYLAFSMDYFYGLKDIKNIDTFYDLLFNRKDDFLVKTPNTFDATLFEFINKDLDEPHTSYGYAGYYNRKTYAGPSLTSLGQLGNRVRGFYNNGLYAVDDAIMAKWGITNADLTSEGIGWGYQSVKRQLYFFLDDEKTSVVLSLDGFDTSDIEEDATWNDALVNKVLGIDTSVLPDFTAGSKYFYYNSSPKEYKALEILIKDVQPNHLPTYGVALTTAGFTFNQAGVYYSKTVGDSTYYVQITDDTSYGLLYIGVVKLDADVVLDDEIDVLSFNAFDLVLADSAVYMEVMMDKILSEAPNLANIALDLTFNTGGNVGALYRVLGFVTKDPFRVSSIDRDTNSYSSSYVYIEGVPNYDYLNWALLSSPATFSAANSMVTIFKENDLGIIIGKTSGGGAASITPILLPVGTAFTMSSNNLSAYRTGGDGTEENPYTYEANEFGIAPDYEVAILTTVGGKPFANIYDTNTLLAIFAEAYN